MDILYIMYIEVEMSVTGQIHIITLCDGKRKVYKAKNFNAAVGVIVSLAQSYDVYLDTNGLGAGAASAMSRFNIPFRKLKHEVSVGV